TILRSMHKQNGFGGWKKYTPFLTTRTLWALNTQPQVQYFTLFIYLSSIALELRRLSTERSNNGSFHVLLSSIISVMHNYTKNPITQTHVLEFSFQPNTHFISLIISQERLIKI